MGVNFISRASVSSKDIYFNELKVKHLKTIYKSLIGDDLQADIVFTNLNNILEDIVKGDFLNLSFLDYFILLFEIRCNSIGNIIFGELTEESNTKIEINILKFIDLLKSFDVDDILVPDVIDNVIITYKLPTIAELLLIEKTTTIDEIYSYFIKDITINNISIINTSEALDKNKILDNIPAKITSKAINRVEKVLKKLNELNLLSTTHGMTDKFLPFNCSIKNLTFIVKFLFGNQLLSLYENIFALCKAGNLTPDYIENSTPGEYLLFVKKLEMLSKQRESQGPPATDFDPLSEIS